MEIIKTILSSPDNVRSALDIEKALPGVKSAVMKNLLCELKRLFEKNGCKVLDYDETLIDEYYTSRKHLCPGFTVEIANLTEGVTAVLYVEVYWYLYFGFAFAEINSKEKSSVFLNAKEVMKNYPQEYTEFTTAVLKTVGEGEKTDDLIYWQYILNEKGQKFDFKNFSPSCVDLTLDYGERAKRIFSMLYDYLRSVSNKI